MINSVSLFLVFTLFFLSLNSGLWILRMIESLAKVRVFVVSACGLFVFQPLLSDFGGKTRFLCLLKCLHA